MSTPTNPLELYTLLAKTNCGLCRLPGCMAFAVAVVQGNRRPDECPSLDLDAVQKLLGEVVAKKDLDDDMAEVLARLRVRMADLDLSEAAARTGATLLDQRLAVVCLGRKFVVDQQGDMDSQCHVIGWVQLPLLTYILESKGRQPVGEWVNISAMPGGGPQLQQYFKHRCEEPLRQLMDANGELLDEIFSLFEARREDAAGGRCFTFLPLPLVPLRLQYYPAEEGLPSQLSLLFDATAADNCAPHTLNLLVRGMVEMFRALIVRHSRDGKLF